MTADCCLCSQVAGDPGGDLLHAILGAGSSYERRVVDVAPSFVAMPSVGALVPGHILLCPRAHARSFAAIPDPDSAAAAAHAALDRLASSTNAPVQAFEHGNARYGTSVACTVEHAHLHLLPGLPDLWPELERSANWHTVSPGLSRLRDVVGDGEYVLYIRADGDMHVTLGQGNRAIPSQWLRRIAAAAIDAPDRWNWREHPNPDLTALSFTIAQQALAYDSC
jgi:ATP adenylyltransferase